MSKPCEKCFCYVYDTLLRPLPPSDPFYTIFKFKRIRPIASEVTREILQILTLMGDDLYMNLPALKELVYPVLLCVETGFAQCNRTVSPEQLKYNNPLNYTHLYLQRICISLKMEMKEIHSQHCGLVLVEQKQGITDDDLYA